MSRMAVPVSADVGPPRPAAGDVLLWNARVSTAPAPRRATAAPPAWRAHRIVHVLLGGRIVERDLRALGGGGDGPSPCALALAAGPG
jgi:hypothetical protein